MAAENANFSMVKTIITIAIVVLIVSTVAVPVIQDMTKDINTIEQNTTQSYHMAGGSDSFEMTISSGSPVINGTTVSVIGLVPVLISDNFAVRFMSGSYYVDGDNTTRSTSAITVSPGKITFVDSSSVTQEYTYSSDLFYASNSGTYGFFEPGSVLKYNTDSVMYIVAADTFTNSDLDPTSVGVVGLLKGTATDMKTVWCELTTEDVTLTGTNPLSVSSIVGEDVDIHKEVTVGHLTYSVTTSLGTYQKVVSWGIIAPINYTGLDDADSGLISLINVIPILLFLVPVMLAVRMIAARRN